MVRRSSRLRDKASELRSEVLTVTDGEKDDTESLKCLVKRAYSVIKEKAEEDAMRGEESYTTNAGEAIFGKAEDYIDISSRLKAEVSNCHTLASELNPGLDCNDLYFNVKNINSKCIPSTSKNLHFDEKQIMKKCVVTKDFEKKETAPPYFTSYHSLKRKKKAEKEKTAGCGWFNLSAPEMTAELKRDLNIINMRGILDPKRHYKRTNTKKLPKYFQIGTVVDGPTDFYSSRIPKSQRKRTIIDTLLSDVEFRRYNKRKFLEIQASKAGGRKGFYKRTKRKRR